MKRLSGPFEERLSNLEANGAGEKRRRKAYRCAIERIVGSRRQKRASQGYGNGVAFSKSNRFFAALPDLATCQPPVRLWSAYTPPAPELDPAKTLAVLQAVEPS